MNRELLDTLGIDARRPDNARTTLRVATAEIAVCSPRYRRLEVERLAGGGWSLVAERRPAGG